MNCDIKYSKRRYPKIIILSIILLAVASQPQGFGQACCSGGVPISNNIGVRPIDNSQFIIRGLYDANFLNSFYTGSDKLEDNNIKRLSQTYFLQGIYGITDKLSVNAMLSYVIHKRTVQNSFSSDPVSSENGFGDAILLLQYKILSLRKASIFLTLGPKIPVGKSDLRDANDILLPADLQPGTGSWDVIIGIGYIKSEFIRPSMNLTLTAVGKINSYSDRFNGTQQYKYGNDYQFLFGITDSFIAKKLILNPGILMRLWYTSFDKVDGNNFPNTGGSWIYFVPSLNIAFNPKFSAFISFEIPIYQHLNGTQLSTSIRISGGIQLSLFSNSRKINLNTGN